MQEKLRVIARKSVRQPSLSVSKRLVFLVVACLAGVILGRVVFLHALFPCVLPAFATALFMRKKTALWIGVGLTIGSWTMRAEGTNPWLVVTMMLAFYGLIMVWRRIEAIELSLLPFMVFLVDTGFRLGFYLPITGLSLYTIVISFVDGVLSFLMTSMALQIPAMVTTLRPHTQLRMDEIIAMVIALSSLLTGLHGLTYHGISLEVLSAFYVILMTATLAGAGIAGAVGLIIGVVFALNQVQDAALISVFGLSGVLAGMVKESRRIVIFGAFMLGVSALTFYFMPMQSAIHTIITSLLAICVFAITPRRAWHGMLPYVPGTVEHEQNAQAFSRKIRELMSSRMEAVSHVFEELAYAFHDASALTQHPGLANSRQLIASQLGGVATILDDLSQEVRRETGLNHQHEVQIMAAIGRLGLEMQAIDIVSLEEGNVLIRIFQLEPSEQDECKKLVAPLLSDILGETIGVRSMEKSPDGTCQLVTLVSARSYDVVCGVACAAKDGTVKSGDSYCATDVGDGRYAIAISDGMGNGEEASRESGAAVTLIAQLLKAGFDEQVAIKTVNSALVLRSEKEMYTTLDLAVINLYTLHVELLKIGSVTSFIKEGRNVFAIRGENVPIGILADIDVQTKAITLAENDIVIFVSDGIFDAVAFREDPEIWIKRQLERYESVDPQMVADFLLEAAVRVAGGRINDDMTVLCAKMVLHQPQWSTIRLPNMPKVRRKKSSRLSKNGDRRGLVTM